MGAEALQEKFLKSSSVYDDTRICVRVSQWSLVFAGPVLAGVAGHSSLLRVFTAAVWRTASSCVTHSQQLSVHTLHCDCSCVTHSQQL